MIDYNAIRADIVRFNERRGPKAHEHRYVPHYAPGWAGSHHFCRICGFACPNRLVPPRQIEPLDVETAT